MDDRIILFDYFERTVGTLEEQPYFELVLYRYTETELLLEEYVNGGTPQETVLTYHVPPEVLEQAMQVVRNYDMPSWNTRSDCSNLCGKRYLCKFQDGSRFIRASSDSVPENGMSAFSEIRDILSQYAVEQYRTQ